MGPSEEEEIEQEDMVLLILLLTSYHFFAFTAELQWREHRWNHENMFETGVVVVVVVLLFYVHGKHLRSCRDGQLPHFSWAGLDLLSG